MTHPARNVRLTGHQGLLDAIAQSLSAAGAAVSRLAHEGHDVERLRHNIRRADAARNLMRQALEGGVTIEQDPDAYDVDPDAREFWEERIAAADWTAAETRVWDYVK